MSLYLVRHAHTQQSEAPSDEWTLSDRGRREAAALATAELWANVAAAYSSPEVKAVESIAPAVEAWGLPCRLDARLREVERPHTWHEDYGEVARRFLTSPEPPQGWEPRDTALNRVAACLREIEQTHAGQDVVICSHGLLLTLYVSGLAGAEADPFEIWRSIGFGVVAVVSGDRLVRPFGPPELVR